MNKTEKNSQICAENSVKQQVFDCYTDGSGNNLSPMKEGGAAYVVLYEGDIVHEKSKGFLHTTTNRMEMLAIISAVDFCPKGSIVNVYTDSRYAADTFSGVKSRYSGTVSNRDLIALFHQCAEGKDVRMHWIKGHNGNEYNEYVDDLANIAYDNIRKMYGLPEFNWQNYRRRKRVAV